MVKWELLGPKSAFGGKWDPKPSIFRRFKATSREGAPRGAFARKVALFAKQHQNDENPLFPCKWMEFSGNGSFAKRQPRGDRILGPALSVTDVHRRYAGSVQHRHARAGWRSLRNEAPFSGALRPPCPHSNQHNAFSIIFVCSAVADNVHHSSVRRHLKT